MEIPDRLGILPNTTHSKYRYYKSQSGTCLLPSLKNSHSIQKKFLLAHGLPVEPKLIFITAS